MLKNAQKDFIQRHIGASEKEQGTMLQELGYKNLDELIKKTVPEKIAYTETANPLKDNAPPKIPNTKSVRTSKWKLIFNQYDNTKELYNLVEDPNEENNLIGNLLDIENELWIELKKLDVL